MSSILETLKEKVLDAMEAAYGEAIKGCDPAVTASTDSRFGHYQCNAAMGLAKRLGKKPREIAGELVNALQLEEMCLPVEVAGPGFIRKSRNKPVLIAWIMSGPDDFGGDPSGIPERSS